MNIASKALTVMVTGFVFASNAAVADDECKMYFKAAGGYGVNFKQAKVGETDLYSALNLSTLTSSGNNLNGTVDKKGKGVNAEFGVGYNFSDALRADVTLGYSKNSSDIAKTKGNVVNVTAPKFEQNVLNLTANAYYSFNNNSAFSPFVTAGLGVQSSRNKITGLTAVDLSTEGARVVLSTRKDALTPADADVTKVAQVGEIKSKRSYNFSYQVGAGVSYKLDDGVYLDLSYRIQNLAGNDFPKTDKKNPAVYIASVATSAAPAKYTIATAPTAVAGKIKNNFKHSIMAGLRVEF